MTTLKDLTTRNIAPQTQSLKDQFKKPSPLPPSKYPDGHGKSKGDILVQRLALEFQHDPVAELVKLAKSNRISPDLKAKINMELIQYYIPKLRAIDTNPNQGETIQINIIDSNTKVNTNDKTIDITSR